MHSGIGLLYQDFEGVMRKPGAANVTPVGAKVKKEVKWEQWTEQWTVKITAGVATVIEAVSGLLAEASISQIKETHIQP